MRLRSSSSQSLVVRRVRVRRSTSQGPSGSERLYGLVRRRHRQRPEQAGSFDSFNVENAPINGCWSLQVNALFRRVTEKDEWGSGFLTVVRLRRAGAGRDDAGADGPFAARLYRQRSDPRGHAAEQPVRRRGGRAVREVRFDTVEAHRRVPVSRADSSPNKFVVTVPPPASLDRRLGPLDASAIVISNVIGVGIFTTPVWSPTCCRTTTAMLAVWAFGGALAFAGALAYAELAAWRPQAGGEYVYLRESFGRLAAFLTGWTSFVAGFSGRSRPARSPSRSIWIDSFPAPATRGPRGAGRSVRSRSSSRRAPWSRSPHRLLALDPGRAASDRPGGPELR